MAVWISPITAPHSPPLSACIADHERHPSTLHVGYMRPVALAVEAGCMKNCYNRQSVRLAAEGASQVSSEVYGCCKKVGRMEWVAVVAGGSRNLEIEVQKTQTVALAGRRTIGG